MIYRLRGWSERSARAMAQLGCRPDGRCENFEPDGPQSVAHRVGQYDGRRDRAAFTEPLTPSEFNGDGVWRCSTSMGGTSRR